MESLPSQSSLDALNVPQAKSENRAKLQALGDAQGLVELLGSNLHVGLTDIQVLNLRQTYGTNAFPESPFESYWTMLMRALSDTTLLILVAAATVSLIIGTLTKEKEWVQGVAIFICVILISNISAGNDYTKQLQFKALEDSSAKSERCTVLREGLISHINPVDLVVGDILVLQVGDQIPADCVLFTDPPVKANESSLTGESDDLLKSRDDDPFLLSSCLLTEGEAECRALVIGIGAHSQWGKIKAQLVTEVVNTPLQDKLQDLTTQIGYIGTVVALGTFIALIISIWTVHQGRDILARVIDAFIIAVTLVVVAIPEGLPLAVTICFAYSTKKMYEDQCLIRVLAACETLGNATNICSDKTGTLTENRMTVVEGWLGDTLFTQDATVEQWCVPGGVKQLLIEQVSINRSAYLIYQDSEGRMLERPIIIGNKTEGALILMVQSWGEDCDAIKNDRFNEKMDKTFAFNSNKKRSTAVLHRVDDNSVRVYCKGASEWILSDCTHFTNVEGASEAMSDEKRQELALLIESMASRALRTLCLAHRDFASAAAMPSDWTTHPPDSASLCLDGIVGIIDPLRADVKESVRVAQAAGVTVRMVTGDNLTTASAIARQCGILTETGLAMEGPDFRKMTPKEVDAVLPRLQVLARSSPEDKYLLVTRLNGHGVPENREAWIRKHCSLCDAATSTAGAMEGGISWETHRDLLLPGYREEWEATRPDGGDVVGVTGDGTNDAPALKAADVGLAMGITGTKVAQSAADIVLLDDKFSSIVRAITWGRCVYDSIRKFLQFQLTMITTALLIVFIGAVSGSDHPLTAVQMLWVNLIMDSVVALALCTESPVPEQLLSRRPYKRATSVISRPMLRNVGCQVVYQIVVLSLLLFKGPQWFDLRSGEPCAQFKVLRDSDQSQWFVNGTQTFQRVDPASDDAVNHMSASSYLQCSDYSLYCGDSGVDCFESKHRMEFPYFNSTEETIVLDAAFSEFAGFSSHCLTCLVTDFSHGTLIFNTFVFCQLFNLFNSRILLDELNMFRGALTNVLFVGGTLTAVGLQVFLVEIGGDFVRTSPLSGQNWLISVALGAGTLVVGVLMRLIPVVEDPNSFASNIAVMPATAGQEKIVLSDSFDSV